MKPYLHNINRKRYKFMKIRFYIYSNLTGFRANSMLHSIFCTSFFRQ